MGASDTEHEVVRLGRSESEPFERGLRDAPTEILVLEALRADRGSASEETAAHREAVSDTTPNRIENFLLGPLVETVGGVPNFLGVAERLEELRFLLDVTERDRLVVEELPDRATLDEHHVVLTRRRVPASAELARDLVRRVLRPDLRPLGEVVVVDPDDLENVGVAIGRHLAVHARDHRTTTGANEVALPERRFGKLPKELLAPPVVRLLLLELAEGGEATLVLVLVGELEAATPLGILLAIRKPDLDPRAVDVHPRLEAEVAESPVVDLGEAEDGCLRAVGAGVVAPVPILLVDGDGDFVADSHQFVDHAYSPFVLSLECAVF